MKNDVYIALMVSAILVALILMLMSISSPPPSYLENGTVVFRIQVMSSRFPVHLILMNDTCGFMIDGTYVQKLPANFTVINSYYQQNRFYPYNYTYDGRRAYVAFAAQTPYLRCITAIAINHTMYSLYPYALNRTLIRLV